MSPLRAASANETATFSPLANLHTLGVAIACLVPGRRTEQGRVVSAKEYELAAQPHPKTALQTRIRHQDFVFFLLALGVGAEGRLHKEDAAAGSGKYRTNQKRS